MDYRPCVSLLVFLASLAGLSSGMNEACLKIPSCTDGQIKQLLLDDEITEEYCTKTLEIVTCIEKYTPDCDVDEIVGAFNETAKNYKVNYDKKCVVSLRYSLASGQTLSECNREIHACITPDIEYYRSKGNRTQYCKSAPNMVACMDYVLEQRCKHTGMVSMQELDVMRSEINKMYTNIQIYCEPEKSGARHGLNISSILCAAFTLVFWTVTVCC